MKRLLSLVTLSVLAVSASAAPLRVFIRGGAKSHGPNAHEHERFLNDWKPLLTQRGMTTDGALDWPTAEQLLKTDVLVMYAQEGGNATPEQKANLAEFTKRGGGIVVIHTASVSNDPAWWKSVIGGAWVQGKTKWKEGPMDLYYVENQRLGEQHPITKGASNFSIDDEIYYDMDLSPDIRVLATSYTPNIPGGKRAAGDKASVYDIQPQMWTYEKDGYRAFVCIPGHLYPNFELPFFRAILMRGIAWAGKRTNVDEFCKPEEISALTYPQGGPQRPADTLKALELHPDFTMKLVASEPLITKPMNYDWDPAGRLWVAETPEYPNGRRGMRPDYRGREWKDHGGIDPTPGQQERKAIDKISILTDTNGDGVMDKKAIFYEGLELVTGLVFHKDGVIVTQAPDILWLRDTDHDGKADKVEKLYTGLGTGDTHAVINNPRRGWDGWIYCTHGYSGGQVKSGDGSKNFGNIGSGVVRFKPDGSAFEQYSSKGGNTWGLQITGDNRVMWTQPTSGELLMQTVLPEYALARGKVGNTASYHVVEKSGKTFPAITSDRIPYLQIDWVGSFTAAAGCVIYDGGAWPNEYNGDYFTTEPTINLVHHARLTPQGPSYTFHKLPGREETEFIRSKDLWWRPIEVRVGPDGAMYVGDFYNQAVVHNDTRGPDHNGVNAAVRPDRDHYFGRIWRVDHKDAKKTAVPNLAKAGVKELAKALEHPNASVRMTASRLLIEAAGRTEEIDSILDPISNPLAVDWDKKTSETKIASLWTLAGLDSVDAELFKKAIADPDAAVRRNAALICESSGAAFTSTLVNDSDAQVRVAALRALAAGKLSDEAAKALVAAWPKLDDNFQRSAAVGAASRNPSAVISAALDSADSPALAPLVNALIPRLADPEMAAKMVIALADKPATVDPLKRDILNSLGKTVQGAPAATPELTAALSKLLTSKVGENALPLVAKWDKAGALKSANEQKTKELFAKLDTGDDDSRFATAEALLSLRSVSESALPAVIKAATGDASPALKRRLMTALGATGDPRVGTMLAASFGSFPPEVQGTAYEMLLQRAEWSLALLDAAKSKKADITTLGPANLARLRTHPDAAVAKTANAVLDELMGPSIKAKAETLAKLTPEVVKPGDAAKGKILFTAACATCHKLNDQGADIGPGLTGMGAHGPAELLAAIIDPNREIDPSFVAYNIETKDGKYHAGVIARENPTSLVLRSLAGEEEIRIADIKSRVNTGRSLMPEGFEGLGGETLRDILAYICGSESGKFRTLDLHGAFTTSTARGLYESAAATDQTFQFRKTGAVMIEGIPFSVVPPEKAAGGSNIIVLKGGPPNSVSQTMPQRVEIKVGGFKANRLHFLGGVTGWGFQNNNERGDVLKITVHAVGGASETIVCKNGTEFSDYINRLDVPGSKHADGVVKNHQVRWFTKALKGAMEIDRITLESFGTNAAPTTIAITAELTDGK
jgi:putative membrane-bound dehydrogenase-like protein